MVEQSEPIPPFVLRHTVVPGDLPTTACDLLAARSGLAKGRIKDAMIKGAVWLTGRKGGRKRLRRATTLLRKGDLLECYYDEALLAVKPPTADCLDDATRYSLWLKPAGLLAQGTDYGDHCSLLRQVELFFKGSRPALPVHRLDREAVGLMLVAHDRQAAAALSQILQQQRIEKGYRIKVLGCPEPSAGRIELPLDGKPASTTYTVSDYDPIADTATVEVRIATGRLHQIRRHFALIGHPVLGDPRYGTGNKNREGLQLLAHSLALVCPFSGKPLRFSLAEDASLTG